MARVSQSSFVTEWLSSQEGRRSRLAMSAIGTKQTCSTRGRMSAFGSKADSDQPLLTNLDFMTNVWTGFALSPAGARAVRHETGSARFPTAY
jgi:hypothetical protein